ncbi:MAG: hypothetical protein M3Y07_18955 [Acidobacteriota bacterium]|nr:hypothetical protein [Acidobacteriota bacterium]
MRNVRTKLFIVAALTGLVAFGADNSLGTWKLNMEKSKFDPAPGPVKSLTSTREASDGGVKVTTTGEQANGTPINASYAAKYDGKEFPVTGAPWDTMTLKRVNANTSTATTKKSDGKYRGTSRTVISKDGKTMTTTSKGTGEDGKAFHNVLVFDKQ